MSFLNLSWIDMKKRMRYDIGIRMVQPNQKQ